jgi:tRNA/tmRNA/rRNA uracil-C5-methylase (TrmA/RlmC/RlmD family)
VLELAEGDRVIDLYAGVGLFSIALAARGSEVVAVEGDRSSGADLTANADPWDRLRVVHAAVEDIARYPPEPPPDVVVIDPPRTGISAVAVRGLANVAGGAPRLRVVRSADARARRRAIRRRRVRADVSGRV